LQLLRVEQKMENELPVIYLFCRDGNGIRTIEKVKDFKPYFYIPDINGNFTSFDGIKCRRIETVLPEEVREQRDRYEKTYESDVRFPNRFLIDSISSLEYTKPKIFYLDIEVDNAGKMPKPENATDAIVCIGVYDNLTEIYSTFVFRSDLVEGEQSDIFDDSLHEIHYYKTEKDMLAGFIEYFRESGPDGITGWNLALFDMIYLLSRMIFIGMDINALSPINQSYIKGTTETVIKGVAIIDLMRAYRHLSENLEESYTLDYIARKVTGKGKTEDSAQIRWLWKNELQRLINYNIGDVELVRKIDEKLKLLDFLDEVRRTCFCQLEDTLTTTRTLDAYVLHMFHNKIVFPTKIHGEEHEAFEGGFVHTWAKGI
jgi:DNA polymerase I